MLRIAICQINATVGDLDGNLERIRRAADRAASAGAELALYPELTVTGYPPEDLLLKPRFLDRAAATLLDPIPDLPLPCLVGLPWRDPADGALHNAAALLADGECKALYRKTLLPNYAVFDEVRYFTPGGRGLVIEAGGCRLGVVICEDAWDTTGPARDEAAAGADTILNLSASPFHKGKEAVRRETFGALCREHDVRFVWCNLLGGQDELVFDGASLALDRDGKELARGAAFAEDIFCIDLPPPATPRPPAPRTERPVETVRLELSERSRPPLPAHAVAPLDELDAIYACLALGVGDYVRKNGFADAVLGLSGGIDSALAACVAVDALGAEHVTGVTMPSRYSSDATRADAGRLAESLGIRLLTLPVEGPFTAFLDALRPVFAGRAPDVTEENLQARVRAVYLMALSNKFGQLVLNTGNKSEAAVGYTTIYGDSIGAYSVLKDVFKTTVFALARRVNERAGRERIPQSIIDRPPTAELRPDQQDSDSLPAYDLLDPVLAAYIEEDLSVDEMIARGFDPDVVARAVRMTDAAEWKRRQSVPGPRVTPKAFGKDRRLPVTNRYRG